MYLWFPKLKLVTVTVAITEETKWLSAVKIST